jgi:hypothetical protein
VLSDHERTFLLTRRVEYLATTDSRAIPHVVPVCFTISQGTFYFTIDEKPKRVAGPALKRVRNGDRVQAAAQYVAMGQERPRASLPTEPEHWPLPDDQPVELATNVALSLQIGQY